jgi:hypothetical protein
VAPRDPAFLVILDPELAFVHSPELDRPEVCRAATRKHLVRRHPGSRLGLPSPARRLVVFPCNTPPLTWKLRVGRCGLKGTAAHTAALEDSRLLPLELGSR